MGSRRCNPLDAFASTTGGEMTDKIKNALIATIILIAGSYVFGYFFGLGFWESVNVVVK
jgi:hypothetical protein